MVGEAGRTAMADVAGRGAMRGLDGGVQVITREQSGELGCAPHVAASGRIAAVDHVIGRDERRAQRPERRAERRAAFRRRSASKSGDAKYTAPRLPSVTDRLRTPACSAVAASAIGSGASIVISSSFT